MGEREERERVRVGGSEAETIIFLQSFAKKVKTVKGSVLP